jgi:Ca2+-transporting ATPase
VTKRKRALVFAGTVVVRGRGVAEVTTIGAVTKMGQIARLVTETKENQTPLELRLRGLSRQLSFVLSGVAISLFFLALLRGESVDTALVTTIALAVAVIPEGLPIMVTLMLAIGMERLARRRATVRRLSAVETLGSVTVAAVDKTGTITTGQLEVAEVIGDDPEPVIRLAVLASDIGLGTLATPDPLETALGLEAGRLGMAPETLHREARRLKVIPFDARYRYMACWVKQSTEQFVAIKGAPEALLPNCRLTSKTRQEIERHVTRLTEAGFRVLLIAEARSQTVVGRAPKLPTTLTYRGLVSFTDPVRPDAKKALHDLIEAGLRPIVITGDHPTTARTIMAQLGFTLTNKEILTGEELRSLTPAALKQRLPHILLAARILPDEKLLLVEGLQALGEVVAMTGDGVNDGPALKKAEIGIAMGESGTEVAKEIADLILLDDSLSTIVAAVEEGRTIVQNLKKGILYLMGTNIAELVVIIGAIALGWPLPLTATQILWINLVSDTLPVAGLAFETSPDALKRGPTHVATRLIDGLLIRRMLVIGAVIGVGCLWIFVQTNSGHLALSQTITFSTLAVMQIMIALSVRSLKNFRLPWSQPNVALLLSLLIAFLIQLVAVYSLDGALRTVPLAAAQWIPIILLGLAGLVIVELIKQLEATLTPHKYR